MDVRELRPDDHEHWARLFAGYREFYRLEPDEAVVERVWSWLRDREHELDAFVATLDDEVVGIAHHRPVSDPSSGTVGTWLDDLFTDPTARGRGVGRSLLGRLGQLAADSGRSGTSWITAEDNATARRLYDDVARATDWVVYDAVPGEPVVARRDVEVRPLRTEDRERWRALFVGYRAFYRLEPDDAVVDRVWTWAHDPGHEVEALVATLEGEVVGIAHHRPFTRPSTGTVGLWLDDLFADPAARGRGVARALLSRVTTIAGERGSSVVRWVTAADNATARRLYDDVATRTRWVVYEQ